MKTSKDLLSSVLKTTQMGQIGIRSTLHYNLQPNLKAAMQSQLKEYDAIETEAHRIAQNRQWKPDELNPSIRFMVERTAKLKLAFGNADSKIAAMMIRGNTSGVIKQLRNLHQLNVTDEAVTAIVNKLIETESANVHQMKPFL